MIERAVFIVSLSLLVGIAVAPAGAQDATPATTPKQGAPIEVQVELDDFSVTPARTALIAGQPYRFVVTNAGAVTHEFVIEPADVVDQPLEAEGEGEERESEIEDIGPGETKDLLWTFTEPGEYQMSCHIPDHYEAGMKTAFTVVTDDTETVQVELGDFFITPEVTELKADTLYLFEVTNAGAATHEFVIEPEGEVDQPLDIESAGGEVESEIEDIAPGQTKTLLWTFAEPGAYQMACHIPDHYEEGMKTAFEVVP